MMDENNIDDFEQFLKTQADKHRMYPSDQLWRNINHQLHGNSRWPALTFAAILTGALLTACLIFMRPDADLFNTHGIADATITNTTTHKTVDISAATDNEHPVVLKPIDDKTALYSFNKPVHQEEIAGHGISTIVPAQIATEAVLNSGTKTELLLNNVSAATINAQDKTIKPSSTLLLAAAQIAQTDNEAIQTDVAEETTAALMVTNSNPIPTITPEEATFLEPVVTNNAAIKSAIPRLKNKLSVTFYGGPSISYRRLSQPASYDYHFPYNAALTADPRKNVNNAVSQRPTVGIELGSAITYAINDRLKIKAGLQFNIRQYNIDAFRATNEPSVLVLSNVSSAPDSMVVYSSIRNGDGFKALTLQNRYYQIGAPVGFEWTFAEGRKVNLSLGATVQPTYQLNTNVYMLTSDYKNYVQQPNMVRRWNVNAGIEALANFKAGGLQWQVGPQLRYQMQPTQVKNYSIHENLVDYGVKVGIIKQLH